jgi:hypothetical protein
MLEVAYDRGAVALVARIIGTVSDEELKQFGAALVTLDVAALESKRTPVTILIVVMSGTPPSAAQRRLMADLWRPMRAPLHVFALVSTSSVARGVRKVVQWLNPPGTKRHEAVYASVEDAAKWTEQERGEPIPALRILARQLDRAAPVGTAIRR